MDSCKFTPFGLCVKTELLKRGKTQKWLEEEITNRTGLFADSGYIVPMPVLVFCWVMSFVCWLIYSYALGVGEGAAKEMKKQIRDGEGGQCE